MASCSQARAKSHAPVGSRSGNAHHGSRFGEIEAGKIQELHELGLLGVHSRQLSQRLVEFQEIVEIVAR